MTLILSVIAFVIGWAWNTYIMAVDLGGSVVDPDAETAATAEGHTGNIVYWLVLFSLVAGLVSYAWSRGWRAFGSDLVTLPRRFGQAMASSPAASLGMLLWGMSISLVISTLISSAVSAVLGLALLALAATPFGVVLNFALIRIWRGLTGIVAPNASARLAGMVSPFMVMVGEALGLFVDWAVGVWIIGLVLGIVCAVGSVLIVRAIPSPRAAVVLFAVGAVVSMQVFRIPGARADDGGWSECATAEGAPCTGIGGLFDWIVSPGADVVIARGTIGGVGAALGAVLGAGLGAAVAGLAAATAQASAASGGGSGWSTGEPHAGEHTIEPPTAGPHSTEPPTDWPRIPHQESWPEPGAATPTGAGADLSAHLDAGSHAGATAAGGGFGVSNVDPTGPSTDADVDSRSLAGGGEGASRVAPHLDMEDLLPDEPERKRRDTDLDGPPEPPPNA
jgi:hypothetical protein